MISAATILQVNKLLVPKVYSFSCKESTELMKYAEYIDQTETNKKWRMVLQETYKKCKTNKANISK